MSAFGGNADMQKSHHQAQAGAAPCAKPSQLVQGPTSSPNLNCNCCDFEGRASCMHFIERLFGFAPDHGDGSLEAIILIAVVIVITGLGLGYFYKHFPRK
jgi:hypothetical protein